VTLKELNPCTHIRRRDNVIEFRRGEKSYYAFCPLCGEKMVWDNWAKLCESLRARCPGCSLTLPSIELDLESEKGGANSGSSMTGVPASEAHQPDPKEIAKAKNIKSG
jgi:hypothetical protein